MHNLDNRYFNNKRGKFKMLNFVFIILIVLSMLMNIYCNPKRYDNYKVFRIVPTTEEHMDSIRKFGNLNGSSFWIGPYGISKPVDLQVSPIHLDEFDTLMMSKGITPMVLIENLQTLIDAQKTSTESRAGGIFNFKDYNDLDVIYSWMETLTLTNRNNVEKIVAGKTYQGREIKGVKITFGMKKRGIFIEGGIHAREWISPAALVYLMDRLLSSRDPDVRYLAESYDWYIFPIFNPDGYWYTHHVDRMWRKTVSDTGYGDNPNDSNCKGVDLNRNFDYMWQPHPDPCHEQYPGPRAFSEIESKSVSTYIKTLRGKLFAYLSIHSYTQSLLLPYDYTEEQLDNYDEAYTIAYSAIGALYEKHGTPYRVGNRYELFERLATGTVMDWAKGHMELELVYTYKLRGDNRYGFMLPPEQIVETSEEFIASLVAMFKHAKNLGYPKNKRLGTSSYSGEGSSSSSGGRASKGIFKFAKCFSGG